MMGTMSKGSEQRAQLGLTEHSSSGYVWESRTHMHMHTHAHAHARSKPLKGQEWSPRVHVE